MATYEYDFSAFESSAARKLRVKEENEQRPRLIKLEAEPVFEEKSAQEIRNDNRKARVRYIRAAVVLVVLSALFMTYIYAFCQCDSIDRQINSLNTQYNMVCGENTELSMKLSNMVSLEQIEKTAVEELGLVKLNSADVEFVRLESENKVLVTQGKTAQ